VKNEPIWHEFVKKSLELCSEGGYISLIHPSGWRNVSGKFKETQNVIKNNNLIYLNINDVQTGKLLFNVTTPFDWYILQKSIYNGKTLINFDNNVNNIVDISQMEYIPNSNMDKINKLMVTEFGDTVNVLYSRTSYGSDKSNMNREKTNEFKYPCVYSIVGNDEPILFYSNVNDKGHFAIPKLILGNGANPKCFIDYNGDYGLTQFAFGIIDEPENLEKIKIVLESEEFQKINLSTKFVATGGNPLVYPRIISTFRKDFWKEFI